jgi:hypothetical protein
MKSHYYCGAVLEEARTAVMLITNARGIKEVMIYMNNCNVYNPAKMIKD